MVRHFILLIAALVVMPSLVPAQDGGTFVSAKPTVAPPSKAAIKHDNELRRRRVDYIDAKSLGEQFKSLAWRANKRKPPAVVGTTLLTSGDEQTLYSIVRRITSSEPEVHARWDDIVIVRSGTGAIEMGDSLTGSTYRAPGERRGGKFTKGTQLVLRPGDIVRIPAAVPHAFHVAGGEPLEYMLIKQRRQQLPIRWFGDK